MVIIWKQHRYTAIEKHIFDCKLHELGEIICWLCEHRLLHTLWLCSAGRNPNVCP